MRKEKSVLILTAHFGEGHTQTAETIADTFRNLGHHVHIRDLYGEAYPAIHSIAQNLLKKGFSKFGTPFYKAFYYGTDKLSSKGLSYFYQHLGKKRLLKLIETYSPSCIVTTFPLPAAPYLRLRSSFNIPTYTVITDYCAHPLWIHPMIEKYYVASEQVRRTLTTYGVEKQRIIVSGLPIRSCFQPHAEKPYKELGLSPDRKTVTFMGGGLGLVPNIEPVLSSLSKDPNLQAVVVCGRNKELYLHLKNVVKCPNIHIYGYMTGMEKLFSLTDCLVTKSGAITLTEAASFKLPIIIFKPAPGQENENANYFFQEGAALKYVTHYDFLKNIYRCLYDKNTKDSLSGKVYSVYKENACISIVEDILRHEHKQSYPSERRM
ncbi:diacylglycerol glucosyltransferase [Bacillus sp. BHET2]|uniref:MGDG synthase family glycosyltransferase n=1 Tax=Bacillus sp. BHET2 TaxID=2583818 RepID=UPI00110F37A8|nr:glycosyltransferase [Bacillus sp. BHET2]TMU86830.1 diacylglycerol glucosyltransferase [Bacillus sp. BHET2]